MQVFDNNMRRASRRASLRQDPYRHCRRSRTRFLGTYSSDSSCPSCSARRRPLSRRTCSTPWTSPASRPSPCSSGSPWPPWEPCSSTTSSR
ncbi:GD25864 [Drosophila simulans]|uniref:GD25864 n=1 Tax=Drosophila simulans TaxID=7240 RepID=B4QC75_DROSI|nr:GD25864 [Drosophila simulans]